MKPEDEPLTHDSAHYINRELSQVEFNRRVLEQAKDARVPLLERLRFLTISCSNLDEFFEIRVSGLKQQLDLGVHQSGPDGLDPEQMLQQIGVRVHELVNEQYRVWNELLLPALETAGIDVLQQQRWSPAQADWVREHFRREVQPVLTPVGLDPAHPFPRVLNKSLNIAVSLEGDDAFERSSGIAVVQVPRALPRLLQLPEELCGGRTQFVLLSWIVQAHVAELFPGMNVTGCYPFRLTRNSELWVEEEEVEDLLHAVLGELPRRRYGDAVRLEVTLDCPLDMAQFLLAQFGLAEADLYRVAGPVNLPRLDQIHARVNNRPELKYRGFTPGVPRALSAGRDIFAQLRAGDLLLNHPFQSFGPVIDFLRQAAADPDVLAIKQTLYRAGADSPLVEALIEAAHAGKEVTVVVELMARFDEANNADLATRLQDAGVNVLYGVVGYKTHAKMLLVVRRESKKLRRYVHVGTGNYHPGTARAYTDLSLLTCDKDVGEDVHQLFLQLTGLGRAQPLRKLIQAPFHMQGRLLELIESEAKLARAGKRARIVAKMNSLCEQQVIRALYAASRAGVEIDLVVRGICSLRPGVPGLSERIRVRSIVGRFLEHSRVFHFGADGQDLVYVASADWMPRNFFKRVELCCPIEDPVLRQRVIGDLQVYLADNVQAWELRADGSYVRASSEGAELVSAQDTLLARHMDSAHEQAHADGAQGGRFLVKVRPGEGVGVEPVLRKPKLKRVAVDGHAQRRQRARAAAAVQKNRQAQQDAQTKR